jgi:hypothetical protein
MPDQTIALQLNIDTNAPDAIDQVKQKIDELQEKLAASAKDTKEFTDALANLNTAKELLGQLTTSMEGHITATDAGTVAMGKYNDALDGIKIGRQEFEALHKSLDAIAPASAAAQFEKFGQKATEALKGIGAAAALAAANSTDLQKILDKATAAATKESTQKLAAIKTDNAAGLKETESFEKSNLDIKTKYQALDISSTEQTATEKKRILDSEFAAAKDGANALIALADTMVENGKKNTESQKATALIKIGIDTAKAISSLVAASNENPANAATSGVCIWSRGNYCQYFKSKRYPGWGYKWIGFRVCARHKYRSAEP